MRAFPRRELIDVKFEAEVSVPYGELNPLLMNKYDPDHLPHAVGILPVKVLSSSMYNGVDTFHTTEEEKGVFHVRLLREIGIKTIRPREEHSILTMDSEIQVYGRFDHLNPTAYDLKHIPQDFERTEEGHVIYDVAKLTIADYSHETSQVIGKLSLVHSMPF